MLRLTALNLLKRRLTSAVSLPPLLMLILTGGSIWQINGLLSAMGWVEHTDWVISQANIIQRLITDEESSIRGYLITSDPEFLAPYNQANSLLLPSFEKLRDLVSDNPPQVERLDRVRLKYQQWSQDNSSLIELGQKKQVPSTSVLKTRQNLMNEIRNRMGEFIEIEEKLRSVRTQTVQRTTRTVTGTSILLATVLGGILAIFIRRQLLSISQTYEKALKVAQEQTEISDRSARRLANLHEIDRAILSALSIQSLAEQVLSQLKNLISYQQAAVILFDLESKQAMVLAGQIPGKSRKKVVSIDNWIPLDPIEFRQSNYYVRDIAQAKLRPPGLEEILAEGYHSFLSVAMHVEDSLMGSLCLFELQPDAFAEKDREIVSEVADQLAIGIQQSQLREKLQRNAIELEERVVERTAKLQETNQEMEAFAYSVSHDLRAPLRTIEGFAQALLEDYSDRLDDTGKEYTRYLIEGAQQMDTLIADLLAYSRLSRAEIQLQTVSLEDIVSEVLNKLKIQIQESQAQITVENLSFQVMAHPPTIVQVLINLVSNAIKFVKPEKTPKIRIWAEEERDGARLWIEDNGIGIAPEHQERIFRVFERLHGVETYPGTGIGLAIVRKGIERMGGRVGVESKLDQGSCFWIALSKTVFDRTGENDKSEASHSFN